MFFWLLFLQDLPSLWLFERKMIVQLYFAEAEWHVAHSVVIYSMLHIYVYVCTHVWNLMPMVLTLHIKCNVEHADGVNWALLACRNLKTRTSTLSILLINFEIWLLTYQCGKAPVQHKTWARQLADYLKSFFPPVILYTFSRNLANVIFFLMSELCEFYFLHLCTIGQERKEEEQYFLVIASIKFLWFDVVCTQLNSTKF